MTHLVTIAIPTYNRPQMLRRALAAVAAQTYPHLDVIVADNHSAGTEAAQVVGEFTAVIPNLRYVRHERNIGAIENFFYLLSVAHGEYFMWLADDDEVSPNYVAALSELLDRDPGAASAAGHWQLMRSESDGQLMPTSAFPQRSALQRVLRFIWRSDDAFFYALHRTAVLRRARFEGYGWPNRRVFLNWAYVLLFDMVLRGRILLPADSSVRFINHDYTEKDYVGTRATVFGVVMHVTRRFNVHWLYWKKSFANLNPLYLPLIVLTSIASLVREAASLVTRRALGSVPGATT
jgi:glycosyltransferase involved in cell wall biosynthesis